MKNKLPKILITAYAVNPYKGSEDGTGWNIIAEIAKQNQVVAITRANNQKAIEKFLDENQLTQANQLRFEYFDLPYWMRFWKKGGRGALLYFYLWQIGLIFFILKKKIKFDIAHHLNFHNDWTPSFLWLLGKPLVWGPIGHHPPIPKAYLISSTGKITYLLDQLKWKVKNCFWAFDPFLKITRWKSQKIIAINSSVKNCLIFETNKEVRLPAVAANLPDESFDDLYKNNKNLPEKMFNVLSIGRFVPLKGFDITIKSFGHFYHNQEAAVQKVLQLTLIGKGPQKAALHQLVKNLKLEEAVLFIDWMPKFELYHYFRSSALFLFPSHEGAGMVIPEALSFNLPILCFDNEGPGELMDATCGFKVPYSTPAESVLAFSKHLGLLYHSKEKLAALSQGAGSYFKEFLTWERKGTVISQAYQDILNSNRRVDVDHNSSNSVNTGLIKT